MTQDEQLDRLERSLQLFLKRPVRVRREAGVTAAKLEAYVTALREYDTAKQVLAARPDDSETRAAFHRAEKSLEVAREKLKRQTPTQRRGLSD
jgi:hypothetical protein